MVLAGAGVLRSQDLARDLPWRRVAPTPAPAACLEQGLLRLERGWNWEAARMFRELVAHDVKHPLGHLGLALALREEPNRAARLCWQAVERKAAAGPEDGAVLEAVQRYFGVLAQPEFVDPRFATPPARERAVALLTELRGLDGRLAARLAAVEAARLAERSFSADLTATLTSHHAYLAQHGAMPFLIPGYRELLALHLEQAPDREAQLSRVPRHPRLGAGSVAPVDALPGLRGDDLVQWQPKQAPDFDLPRGLGGRGKYADYAGKPLLVVFFLGFG